jgi:hypothetical protein
MEAPQVHPAVLKRGAPPYPLHFVDFILPDLSGGMVMECHVAIVDGRHDIIADLNHLQDARFVAHLPTWQVRVFNETRYPRAKEVSDRRAGIAPFRPSLDNSDRHGDAH